MDYLLEISDWVENFIKTICNKSEYSIEETSNITNLYIELRSKYTKDNIDKITKEFLIENNNIIEHFKNKSLAESEINDLFNFFEDKNKLINCEEFKEALSESVFDINKIKDFKIKRIKEIGVLDFVEFKKYFKHDVAFCDIKEALGWCLAYVESGDYNINEIIKYNSKNEIDKSETFKTIIKEINKKSLTNVEPFKFENDKVTFIAAGSSEIDVKLWNESEQRFIGMSATRDRTNIIEGNQFIRHNMQVFAWSAIFDNYKSKNNLPENFKLTTNEIRKIIHDYGWQNKLKDKNILNYDLDSDVIDVINNYHLEFARHLSYVREFIKDKKGVSFHENGLKITEKEISEIIETFKNKTKFYFFGEILGKAEVPEINAGLIKRSYLGNFKNIMSFEMDHKSSKLFLDSIEVRFNNVDSNAEIDKYCEFTSFSFLTKNKKDFEKISAIFSEGKSYKEERGMLYKSISLFMEDLINENDIDSSINLHFGTLSNDFKNLLKDKINNGEIFQNIKENYKTIIKAPSEVNHYSENMFALISSMENKIKYLNQKNENSIMLDFFKSKGIDINIEELEKFKLERNSTDVKQQKNKPL